MNDAATSRRADKDFKPAWSQGDDAQRHTASVQASASSAMSVDVELGRPLGASPDLTPFEALQPPCRIEGPKGLLARLSPVMHDGDPAELSIDAYADADDAAAAAVLALPQHRATTTSSSGAQDPLAPHLKRAASDAMWPAWCEKRGFDSVQAAMTWTQTPSPGAATYSEAFTTKGLQKSPEGPTALDQSLRQALQSLRDAPQKSTIASEAHTTMPYDMSAQNLGGAPLQSPSYSAVEHCATRPSALATRIPYAIESRWGGPVSDSALAPHPAAPRFFNDHFFASPMTSAQHPSAAMQQQGPKASAWGEAETKSTQAFSIDTSATGPLRAREYARHSNGPRAELDVSGSLQASRAASPGVASAYEAAHATQTHASFATPEVPSEKVQAAGAPCIDFSHAMFGEIAGPFHRMLVAQQFEYEVMSTRLDATQAAELRQYQAEVRADYIARELAYECSDERMAAQAIRDASSATTHSHGKRREVSDFCGPKTAHRSSSDAQIGAQSPRHTPSHSKTASVSPGAFARKRHTQDRGAHKDSFRRTIAAQGKLLNDKQNILKDKTDVLKDRLNMVVQQNAGILQQNAELLTLMTKPMELPSQALGEPNWGMQYGLDYIRARWRGRGRIKTRHYWRSMGLISLRICREMLLFGLNTLSFAIPIRLFDRR